jgi:arylsulfatase A-like enzyme
MRTLLALLSLTAYLQAAPRPNILFLIGDNWSCEHAAANGCVAVTTPVFDRLTREGMNFANAFCPVPSCSPTRSCILTGRVAHQLEDAASLWSKFPAKFRVFTDALAESGYHTGFTGKGWSPGKFKEFGRELNPAGKEFKDFTSFLAERKGVTPFFFWLGSTHTALHSFKKADGIVAGIDPTKIRVPAYLPDTPEVRREIANYLAAAKQMDAAFGDAIAQIEKMGQLDNTVIIYTSDNGWQMPRGLANCHDSGSHVPLAVRWPGKVAAGSRSDAFINLTDFAATFLDIASVPKWPTMTSRSFLDVLTGQSNGKGRDHVFLERERHANVRSGDLSYPCRAIRTKDFLYIRNLLPDRWPAGDPALHFAVGPFGDVDPTTTKQLILDHRDEAAMKRYFDINFAKRPAEELYDLRRDPDQIKNLATDLALAATKAKLAARVDAWMQETKDPRVDPAYDAWDRYPYFGGRAKAP